MMTYTPPAPRIGAKYNGYIDAAVAAKQIRADIKAAKADGTLPADIKTSVRTRKYAGGQAIDITISGWDYGRVWQPGPNPWPVMTPAARAVKDKVEVMRGAFNRNASDPMTDYFDVTYYGGTEWDVFPSDDSEVSE